MTHEEVTLIMDSIDSIAMGSVAAERCRNENLPIRARELTDRAKRTRDKVQWLLETMIDDV